MLFKESQGRVLSAALMASPCCFPSAGPAGHLPIDATVLRAKGLVRVREGDPVKDSRQRGVQDD